MGDAEHVVLLKVSVVYCADAGSADEVQLLLAPGSTLADALEQSGLEARHQALARGTAPVGVWGALRDRGEQVREGDRIEIYRPLAVDPKESRRKRLSAARGSSGRRSG